MVYIQVDNRRSPSKDRIAVGFLIDETLAHISHPFGLFQPSPQLINDHDYAVVKDAEEYRHLGVIRLRLEMSCSWWVPSQGS